MTPPLPPSAHITFIYEQNLKEKPHRALQGLGAPLSSNELYRSGTRTLIFLIPPFLFPAPGVSEKKGRKRTGTATRTGSLECSTSHPLNYFPSVSQKQRGSRSRPWSLNQAEAEDNLRNRVPSHKHFRPWTVSHSPTSHAGLLLVCSKHIPLW